MALIGTLTSGVSALKTFSKGLELIGNNIANVNTTAYKSSVASFADTFSNTLRSASVTGDSAIQVGTGVQFAGLTTSFTQGSLSSTGNATDLGISGNGYFVVQDSNGKNYATRDGSFRFDTDGNLINSQGYQVLDDSGAPIQVSGLEKTGSGYQTVPYSQLASVSIGSDGTITAFSTDGTSVIYGYTYDLTVASAAPTPLTTTAKTVGLLAVSDQAKLMKEGNNLYDFSSSGSSLSTDLGTAGADGLGKIQAGTLELSNVDLTDQFANLITTQRSFQAGSRLITVSDSVLEDIVNLKR
jgi:flagellar hook protein FlgE